VSWVEVPMSTAKLDTLRRALRDERSGRVVFLSHCLLNENVRYLGGATRPGGVDEVVAPLQREGVGIVQMPCPEQRAWGGVCKRYTLAAYGADRTGLRLLRRPASWLFLIYTRLAYRRLARRVAHEIGDYTRSGYTVQAVVGIGGSPSCGVRTTLDLPTALGTIARCDPAQLDRREFNNRAIVANARRGEGLFVAALRRQLRRRRLDVPFDEHDLIAEISGYPPCRGLRPGV
jgi:predicted secreted protein